MAAARARGRQAQIGSNGWVLDERQYASELVDEANEEFAFAARDEMEWLNAHMAEIFSANTFNVADVFKTPGKLRGKTPRTAKKLTELESRAPLSEVFSAQKQPARSPVRSKPNAKAAAPAFILAEDKENQEVEPIAPARFSFEFGKENTPDLALNEGDDVESSSNNFEILGRTPIALAASPKKIATPLGFMQSTPQRLRTILQVESARRSQSHESFVSAQERNSGGSTPRAIPREAQSSSKPAPIDSTSPPKAILPDNIAEKPASIYQVSAETTAGLHAIFDEVDKHGAINESQHDGTSVDIEEESVSEPSSPEEPIVRKKTSLNFASLPAREPLQFKKSMGARPSRTSHYDTTTIQQGGSIMPSNTEQNTVFKVDTEDALTGNPPPNEESPEERGRNKTNVAFDSAAKQMHSKTSTQRLHDRITMLSKSIAPQPARVATSMLAGNKRKSQEVTKDEPAINGAIEEPRPADRVESTPTSNEFGSQISAVPVDSQKESMPGSFRASEPKEPPTEEPKSSEAAQLVPSAVHADNLSSAPLRRSSKRLSTIRQSETLPIAPERVAEPSPKRPRTAYPQLQGSTVDSNTPTGSPMTSKQFDGPLSASKAKLYSVFQTARGLFASSAGTSAQAKLESRPPLTRGIEAMSSSERVKVDETPAKAATPTRNLYPDIESAKAGLKDAKKVVEPPTETIRAVRRSSERIRKRSYEIAFDDGTQQVDTQVQQGPPVPEKDHNHVEYPKLDQIDDDQEKDILPPPPPPKSSARVQTKQTEARRPMKAQIKGNAQKSGPASVSILLASQKIGPNPQQSFQSVDSQTSTLVGSQEMSGPPPPPKDASINKKPSVASLKSQSSSQSFKSSASSRPKALEAAARKKEEQEKEAQRKADHRRELERRRAEKIENDKRAAEQQKALAQKALAQKQAAERQRAEAAATARKEQQARAQAQAQAQAQTQAASNGPTRVRQVEDSSNLNRSGYEGARPASRDAVSRPLVPHVNPAKPPPKRHFQGEGDDDFEYSRVNKPVQPSEKRQRITQEPLPDLAQQSRPTMAPPVRMSAIRKEAPNRFTPGYISQANTSYAAQTTFKASVQAYHAPPQQNPKTPHMQDMAKYSSARIPFANHPNTQFQTTSSGYGSSYHQQALQHSARSAQQAKTPLTSNSHRSSPSQYPNGDNISLPEIATDSEDSDAGDDFEPPEWANSPALRDLLRQQQLVDPMKIFGPIAPLMMEEVFKGGDKNRLKKFRDRTSSANWNGPDRLTEEERRRDYEAREKLERDGAWTFDAGN